MKLIGVGDNVCDVYVTSRRMYPGGQALNVAVFAAMQGIEAHYMGVFGQDEVGEHVKCVLSQLGIPAEGSVTVEGDNGFALVEHINGDRRFIGSNKGGVLKQRGFCFGAPEMDIISACDVMHTSNNSYIDPWLEELAQLPVKISYDFSGAWRDADRIKQVCPFADYAFLSIKSEEAPDWIQIGEKLLSSGARHVVMTAGDRGAYYMDAAVSMHQPPHLVKAVDTLGAGDSFASAFLVHVLQGEGVRSSLEQAAVFSAECCLRIGAFGWGKEISERQLAEFEFKINKKSDPRSGGQ